MAGGKGGRPPKPTRTKILQGTFRKSRAKNEPAATVIAKIQSPPSTLSPDGKKFWKKYFPVLVEKRVLTDMDLASFELLCEIWGIYKECKEAVYNKLDDNGGKRKRTLAEYLAGRNSQTMPEYTAMTKAMKDFKELAARFGMSPSDRGKIDLPHGEGDEEKDEMEAIFNAE